MRWEVENIFNQCQNHITQHKSIEQRADSCVTHVDHFYFCIIVLPPVVFMICLWWILFGLVITNLFALCDKRLLSFHNAYAYFVIIISSKRRPQQYGIHNLDPYWNDKCVQGHKTFEYPFEFKAHIHMLIYVRNCQNEFTCTNQRVPYCFCAMRW